MQIDFHHAATYAMARIAGFSHDEAHIVAWSAQYVDDATQSGLVEFHEGSSYRRGASAHKMLDYKNFTSLSQARVWTPFHFLPGNGGLPAGMRPGGDRVDALMVVPDSFPARDMVRAAIDRRDRPWGLHRLGIAMHVYADTWSHQGFCGVRADVNEATDLSWANGEAASSWSDRIATWFVGQALPLGHGAVLSLPDRPYARWSYVNGRGVHVDRDNPGDYLWASQCMVQWMRRFRAGDPDADLPGLPAADEQVFRELIAMEAEWEHRHAAWLAAIAEGRFSFGPAEESYVDRGPGSWKYEALGVEDVNDTLPWRQSFPDSDWKRFHDALQEHTFEVLHVVLPRFGILAT